MGAGAADRWERTGGWSGVWRVFHLPSASSHFEESRARRMSSAAPSPSPAPAPHGAADQQPPTLLSLPIDVIHLILRQVKDARSLVALFATCKVRPSALRCAWMTTSV